MRDDAMKAAAVSVELDSDDSMVIAGGIHPRYAQGQEGHLRATALVLEQNGNKLCLVSCNVLMVERDILDEAAQRIETQSGIPFANILIAATHTHHAPSTVRVHGYDRDENFVKPFRTPSSPLPFKRTRNLLPTPKPSCTFG